VVSVAAKQIIEAYYGHVPALSYFQGCSNGGRQALIEAQRYPADFNGIIAESPVLDQMGTILGYSWKAQAAQTAVPPDKVSLLAAAVLEECDAKDGPPRWPYQRSRGAAGSTRKASSARLAMRRTV
jgi:hypothetical protein